MLAEAQAEPSPMHSPCRVLLRAEHTPGSHTFPVHARQALRKAREPCACTCGVWRSSDPGAAKRCRVLIVGLETGFARFARPASCACAPREGDLAPFWQAACDSVAPARE
jgi:hypothetical protein